MIRPKANSFTLVEMIGAMAILAILASVLAPSVVRQIQTATSVGEDANLADIAQALTNGIRATGIIPNPNLNPTNTNANGFGWAYLASNYTRLSGSNLTSVFPGLINITVSSGVTNTNETYRRLYLSTNLAAAASNGVFTNTITNWGAVMFPTNAKMYLVSASRPDFTLALATNGAGAQTTNNSYANSAVSSLDGWVKQFSNGVTVAPASIVGSWTDRGEFLHVRTIDIAGIFNETRAAQQKAIEQEDANLEEIARALVAGIKATGTIPNPNLSLFSSEGWGTIASGYTTLSSDTLHYSFPGEVGSARRVYLNDQFIKYLVAVAALKAGRVIGQTPDDGWPASAGGVTLANIPLRMYVVSGSKNDLFLYCGDNQATTPPQPSPSYGSALISDLQNWVKKADGPSDPSPGTIKVPDSIAQWGSTYAGGGSFHTRGEFLHVKVVDLRSLFCRVELTDTACPPTAAINVGGDQYLSPYVTFFSGAAAFDVRDSSSVPITISRSLIATDQCVLRNPAPQYVDRTASLSAVIINGDQTASALSPSTATPSLNPQPRFLIPISGSVPPPPAGMFPANVQTFYVLKGTALQLWDNASPVLTTTIESDCSFKYFGSTWTRVD